MSFRFTNKLVCFFSLCAVALGFLLGVTGCATFGGKDAVVDEKTVLSAEELQMLQSGALRTNDLVNVVISGVPQPPVIPPQRIRDDGKIDLPSLGAYLAVGKTPAQLQNELTEAYGKYYKGHVITVTSEARQFFVMGEVHRPGAMPYTPNMTFLRAIATAGGYGTYARKTKIQVIRGSGSTLAVNGRKIDSDPSLDFPIYPGDLIQVPKR